MAAPNRNGLLENFIYSDANWGMWFFYPSEDLPQAFDLLVSERTKLKCYIAQLWYLTKGDELIWHTWD